MLKWIFERCEGTAKAEETPIGNLPSAGELDISGLDDVTPRDLQELLRVDIEGWKAEVQGVREYYANFGDRVPQELHAQLDDLKARLDDAD